MNYSNSYYGSNAANDKIAIALPANRQDAIRKLFDTKEKDGARKNNDFPLFQVYSNFAVANIQTIGKIPPEVYSNKPKKPGEESPLRKELKKIPDDRMYKLADFLWLFKDDDPQKNFPNWRELTIELAIRIYEARNFFSHENGIGIDEIIVDQPFFKFFMDELVTNARIDITGGHHNVEKIYEMKLLNPQTKVTDEERERDPKAYLKNTYAFTRRGLVFLICLALYKDNAVEFCQQLDGLQILSPREIEEKILEEAKILPGSQTTIPENVLNKIDEAQLKARKKKVSQEACRDFFTYYSRRRNYGAINPKEKNFMVFADIINYLNTVPDEAMDFLSLKKERDFLAEEALKYGINLQNALDTVGKTDDEVRQKINRYRLRRRHKNRFLSILAAYCEDFDLFPSLRFKRLDMSPRMGRQKYAYGKQSENDKQQEQDSENSVYKDNGINRHYVICMNALRFEYLPEKHYGDLHIKALRSSVSSAMLQQWVIFNSSCDVANGVKNYFVNYHEILERAINEPDCNYIDRTPYLKAFAAVSGESADSLKGEKFEELLKPYFPVNFIRFFIPRENKPDAKELARNLHDRIEKLLRHDDRILNILNTVFRRQQKKDKTALPPLPPQCRFNDIFLTAQVFRLFNLILPDDRKFRQLPRGKRHRGALDVEYQTMQRLLCGISNDPENLYCYLRGKSPKYETINVNGKPKRKLIGEKDLPRLTCRRPELDPISEKLKKRVDELRKQLPQIPVPYSGRSRFATPSLLLLAIAAVELHREECKRIKTIDFNSLEQLEAACHKLKVKIGMYLTHDAIVKTVLHLDREQWSHAFDYESNTARLHRDLVSEEHIANQIMLPELFNKRLLGSSKDRIIRDCKTPSGGFNFAAFYNLKIARDAPLLRDYYDIAPLVDCLEKMKKLKKQGLTGPALQKALSPEDVADTAWDPDAGLPEEFSPSDENLCVSAFRRAISALREVHYQDRLLLHIAEEYRKSYVQEDKNEGKTGDLAEETVPEVNNEVYTYNNIFGYYNKMRKAVYGGLTVLYYPNDRVRGLFAQICNSKIVPKLAKKYPPKTEISFYDLANKYKEIQREDNQIRLDFMKLIGRFEMEVESRLHIEKNPEEHATTEEKASFSWQHGYSDYYRKNCRTRTISENDFIRLFKFRNGLFHDGFDLRGKYADDLELFKTMLKVPKSYKKW